MAACCGWSEARAQDACEGSEGWRGRRTAWGEALAAHTADLLVGGLAAGAQEVDNELQLGVAVAGDVTLYLFGALRERQQDVGPDTLARSWTAQLRLCRRFRQLERASTSPAWPRGTAHARAALGHLREAELWLEGQARTHRLKARPRPVSKITCGL